MIDGREKAGVGEIMLIKTQMQKERDRAMDDKVCFLFYDTAINVFVHKKDLMCTQTVGSDFTSIYSSSTFDLSRYCWSTGSRKWTLDFTSRSVRIRLL